MIFIALVEAVRGSVLNYQTRKQLAKCDEAVLKDLGISSHERSVEQNKANTLTLLVEIHRKILHEMRNLRD